MSTKSIPIADATEAQLRTFAETYLGISIAYNAKLETIRAKVSEAWSKPEIMVQDESAVENQTMAGAPPRPVTKDQQPPSKDKVRLIIQRTDDAGGDEPVPVGVNGRVMLIPRGEEVDVPVSYFEVLKNAITHRYESLKDGGINPIPRKVPLYPYQIIAT